MPFGTGVSVDTGCRLQVSSSSVLAIALQTSGSIFINGANYNLIDSVGATPFKSNSGLTAATLYYVYCYWDGTAVQIEFSTTAFTASVYGHLVKSGDATRTYLGMVYMGAGTPGTFVDSDTQRFCASYYNRQNKPVQRTALTGTPTTTSATFVELTSGDKVEFIAHGEEWSSCYYNGCALNATVGNICGAAVGVNGTAVALAPNLFNQPVAAAYAMPIAGNIGYKFTAGYNYINMLGKSSGGTVCTFAGANCGFGAMLRQ
jgi:hypothetical protein